MLENMSQADSLKRTKRTVFVDKFLLNSFYKVIGIILLKFYSNFPILILYPHSPAVRITEFVNRDLINMNS